MMIALGYLAFLTAVVYFNYAASVVSGNHTDPHRDDGQ